MPASKKRVRPLWIAVLVAATLSAATNAAPACAHSPYMPQGTLAKVDLYDRQDGASLPVYTKDGRAYVVGVPGHEYALRIRNCTGQRILVVASVDGVNVVSGETASPDQSGYVIDAWASVEIAGWRKSLERTAAFYFTDLGDSYAARTGRPANVGVIGVAVFREKAPPPVAWEPRRDRFAQNAPAAEADASTAGRSVPAPAAAPAAKAAEVGATSRQESAVELAKSTQPRYLESPLGTGHGRNETSYAQPVAFERATAYASETVTIRYDRRDNLVAMGVIPSPRYAARTPDPFPALHFAPDPR